MLTRKVHTASNDVLSCILPHGSRLLRRDSMRPRIQIGFAALLAIAVLVFANISNAQQPSTPSTPPAASTQPATPPDTPQAKPADSQATPPDNTSTDKPSIGATNDPADTKGAKPDKSDKNSKKDAKAEAAKTDSLPSPGEALDPHIKKGSEDDVDAVGTRNIGGRGMGNWYSINSEIGMGKQYSMEIEKSAHMVTDPVVVEYVNRVGQNIVKNSDCKVPFTIKVIDSDEINAMALPGGFFYVNSGLILAADEEAELAGVMAHETAHVCAHHAARQLTRMNYVQIGSIPLIIFTQGSWTGYGIYEATQLAIPITFLEFSREFESEADWLGLQYMYKAGYDPQAFIQFFEKIDALEKHKPGTLAKDASRIIRRPPIASCIPRMRLQRSCRLGQTTL